MSVPRQPDAVPRRPGVTDSPFSTLTGPSPIRVVRRAGKHTAALRQELTEKAAAADQLREALDELRQVLDVENVPAPVSTGRRRLRLLLFGGGGLLALALLILVFLDRSTTEIVAPAATSAAGPATALSPGTAGTAVSASTAVSPSMAGSPGTAVSAGAAVSPGGSPSTHPLQWPGGAVLTPADLTSTGPGADRPGTDVQIAVDPDGVHVDVFERLVLTSASSDRLVLTTLPLPELGRRTAVEDLQVELDGLPVSPAAAGDGSWTIQLPGGRPYTGATLRYRLVNGVFEVTPAAPGRALILVTPLTGAVSRAGSSPVVVRAPDARVIGVSCPAAPGTRTICGTSTTTGWTATVPSDSAPIVLFQIDTKR